MGTAAGGGGFEGDAHRDDDQPVRADECLGVEQQRHDLSGDWGQTVEVRLQLLNEPANQFGFARRPHRFECRDRIADRKSV